MIIVWDCKTGRRDFIELVLKKEKLEAFSVTDTSSETAQEVHSLDPRAIICSPEFKQEVENQIIKEIQEVWNYVDKTESVKSEFVDIVNCKRSDSVGVHSATIVSGSFCFRLYTKAETTVLSIKLRRPTHKYKLSQSFYQDIQWWIDYLNKRICAPD